MKKSLPKQLQEKLNDKYKYLFLNKYFENNSFKDIFYEILKDSFLMLSNMAMRFQIISNALVNIKKTPKIYNKSKDKIDALSLHLNEIMKASNHISDNLYEITKLF